MLHKTNFICVLLYCVLLYRVILHCIYHTMYYYTVYYAMWFTAQSSHLNMYMAAAKSANISSWAFTPGTPIPTAVPFPTP